MEFDPKNPRAPFVADRVHVRRQSNELGVWVDDVPSTWKKFLSNSIHGKHAVYADTDSAARKTEA